MIVVADTTPVNYLVQIDAIFVLERLFRQVVLPLAVLEELLAPGAPAAVRVWAEHLPDWVSVRGGKTDLAADLAHLGAGEREAIVYALQVKADLILLNDGPARKVATRRGLTVAGTLGVLREASNEGWVDFRRSVERIRQLGFRMTDLLQEQRVADSGAAE
jgi:predicted nucleic acid-binding protein